MSKVPAWVLRCRVCKAQFGPLFTKPLVEELLNGSSPLDCGHNGADMVSQSF